MSASKILDRKAFEESGSVFGSARRFVVRRFGFSKVFFCVVAGLAGCSKPSPAPLNLLTAENNLCRIGNTDVVSLKWPDGHKVLVWIDIDGAHNGTAGPSTQGVVYQWSHRERVKRERTVRAGEPKPPQPPMPPQPPQDQNVETVITTYEETNRGVRWKLVSPDGLTGVMDVEGEKFDLAKGNVFLVSTEGMVKVTQLVRDLSGVPVKPESFLTLAKEDKDIRKFVETAVPSK